METHDELRDGLLAGSAHAEGGGFSHVVLVAPLALSSWLCPLHGHPRAAECDGRAPASLPVVILLLSTMAFRVRG